MQGIVVDTQNYLNHNDHIGEGWHSRLPPWQGNRFQLISWWEMEQFTFEAFYNIRFQLDQLKNDYLRPVQAGILTIEDREVKDGEIEYLCGYLTFIEGLCGQIGLTHSQATIKAFMSELDNKKMEGIKASRISVRIEEIDRIIPIEMKGHLFLHVPGNKAEFYHKGALFGDAVNTNFPSAKHDIIEAGACFAFDRYTACVFHLMRVLEVGLAVFAKKFNVPSDHTNWHNIIEQIESKIRGIGNDPARPANWKSEQEFYAQIASHFMFLKDAWRNNVVHRREKYTEEETKHIMENVRAFMQKLATKLSE